MPTLVKSGQHSGSTHLTTPTSGRAPLRLFFLRAPLKALDLSKEAFLAAQAEG